MTYVCKACMTTWMGDTEQEESKLCWYCGQPGASAIKLYPVGQ